MVTKRTIALIDIYSEIPTTSAAITIKQVTNQAIMDRQGFVQNVLIDTIRTLSVGTQNESICNDIIVRCENLTREK